MNCPFQRAFIFLDYVYVIRKSQVVYSYSVYRYSFFAIFDFVHAMNTVGAIGSPCLIPLLVANQLPSCPHTLTAAWAFSLMSLSNRTNWWSTPYDSSTAQVPPSDLCCQMPSWSRRSSWRSFYPFVVFSLLSVSRLGSAVLYSCLCEILLVRPPCVLLSVTSVFQVRPYCDTNKIHWVGFLKKNQVFKPPSKVYHLTQLTKRCLLCSIVFNSVLQLKSTWTSVSPKLNWRNSWKNATFADNKSVICMIIF